MSELKFKNSTEALESFIKEASIKKDINGVDAYSEQFEYENKIYDIKLYDNAKDEKLNDLKVFTTIKDDKPDSSEAVKKGTIQKNPKSEMENTKED